MPRRTTGSPGRRRSTSSGSADAAALDRAAPVSLNADAPLTCQFVLEDHAVRHSFHHLAKIKGAVEARRLSVA